MRSGQAAGEGVTKKRMPALSNLRQLAFILPNEHFRTVDDDIEALDEVSLKLNPPTRGKRIEKSLICFPLTCGTPSPV
jgi:hypothetical protein